MAERLFRMEGPRHLERGLVMLTGGVVFGGSGAVSSQSGVGFTVTKPAGTGLYRCTLDRKYQRLLYAGAIIDNATTPRGQHFEISNVDVGGSTPLVDFQLVQNSTAAISEEVRDHIVEDKAADGAANTTTAENSLGAVFESGTLVDAYVIPDAALTADDTNNAVITISKRDSAGANKTTIATITTNVASGNWVQFARKALTLSNVTIAAGSSFTYEIAKGGTGVQLPALRIALVIDRAQTTAAVAAETNATSGDEAKILLLLSDSGSRV